MQEEFSYRDDGSLNLQNEKPKRFISSWTSWRVVEAAGDTLSYYPYLTARGTAELAATWFSGAGKNLTWQVCKIQVGDPIARLQITKSKQLSSDSWDAIPDGAPVRSTAGEYLPVMFLRDGDIAVASPIQNRWSPDALATRYEIS